MGIVRRQSVRNTAITYAGFALGALNTLVLYTRFMSAEYFGLVGVILSTSALLMPLMSFGIPNTLVKFYAGYREREDLQGLLSMALLLPLLVILPLGAYSFAANATIGEFLARENDVVRDYVWHIFLAGVFMAYFEVFFAWSKVCLQSTVGTFLKEVFVRAGISVLLVMLYLGWVDETQFLMGMVGLYGLRMLLMAFYALRLQPLRLQSSLPGGSREILRYSALILVGGSVSVILLELDRFMINQYIEIENVAYYTVAIFIATVIIVPFRALNQIAYPLTASLLHSGDFRGLEQLYKRSSLTLLAVSALVFLGILLNLEELYRMLPANYRGGFPVVLLIGGVRVFEAFLGINTAILYNSKYYTALLVMGVLLSVLTVLLNTWLIPEMGILGAAVATFLAVTLYNVLKLAFVRWKFGLSPASWGTFKILVLAASTYLLFFWFEFPFHPLVNILLKSCLIALFYGGAVYLLRISEDLNALGRNVFKK